MFMLIIRAVMDTNLFCGHSTTLKVTLNTVDRHDMPFLINKKY